MESNKIRVSSPRRKSRLYNPLDVRRMRSLSWGSASGFTLVEIMIVVAILMILAAVTIPNFIRTRIVASETTAMASCRSISSGCQLFFSQNNTFPSSLSDMIPPTSDPAYIDNDLAAGGKQGYDFEYELVDPGRFTLNANPSTAAFSGFQKHFYMDESGVIRFKAGSPAGPNDEIVG